MKTKETAVRYNIDPETAFPGVEKMLYDLAWRFHARYPLLPFEDAKSQSYWGFMQACRLFKENKGTTFSTFCYFVTTCHLKNLVMARSRDAVHFPLVEIEEESCGTVPPETCDLQDLIHSLPDDARLLAQMLLEVPAELLGVSMTPKQLLRKVKEMLVSEHGKTRRQVDEACAVLRSHFAGEAL